MCHQVISKPVATRGVPFGKTVGTDKLRSLLSAFITEGHTDPWTRLYVDTCYDAGYRYRYVLTNDQCGDILVLPDDGRSEEWFISTRSHESVRFVSRKRTEDLVCAVQMGPSLNGELIQYVLSTANDFEKYIKAVDLKSLRF